MATRDDLKRRINEMAEELTKEFGKLEKSDSSCLMTDIEDFGAELGDALAAEMMKLQLESKASAAEVCPCCSQHGSLKKRRERIVQTRRGDVLLDEPEYYCKHCRKSFFPGIERTRDFAQQSAQPRVPEESYLRGHSCD